jgi:hypothetical protein
VKIEKFARYLKAITDPCTDIIHQPGGLTPIPPFPVLES